MYAMHGNRHQGTVTGEPKAIVLMLKIGFQTMGIVWDCGFPNMFRQFSDPNSVDSTSPTTYAYIHIHIHLHLHLHIIPGHCGQIKWSTPVTR